MKKGFTLVELLTVIAILGVIALIAVISVNSIITNSKEKLSEVNIKKIEELAEGLHIHEGLSSLVTCINVYELIEKGYLKDSLVKDPKTGEEIRGSVKVDYEVNKYTYTYQPFFCMINEYGEFVNEDVVCKEGSFVYGDLDGNDKTNNRDLVLLQAYVPGQTNLSNREFCAFDVNKDKIIGAADIQILQNYLNNSGAITLPYDEDLNYYSITYNLNGGIGTNFKRAVSNFAYELKAPVKEGYEFLGWTWDDVDIPNKQVTISANLENENKSFEYTAHWEKIS